MILRGRTAIITGASLGLGAAVAEKFVGEGASLLLCARNAGPLDETARKLRAKTLPDQIVAAKACDVSREKDVDDLVAEARKLFSHVDALVNNAGVHGSFGPIETVDWTEWKEVVHANLFGTVYPCRLLVPHLKSRGYGKIVNLSGGGATSPLPRASAYAVAKAAVARFTETLAEELKGTGIDVNAVAPGVLDTRLTRQLLDAGPQAVGEALYGRVRRLAADGETAIKKAAELCAYLCSAASDGLTGKLIAAPWDPWPFSPEHRSDLDRSDIFTLRRILPKDRGLGWG
jgi:NAD(P)-dependent dehydrogenase (short-subunit alcohol dehydrogenase family)